MRSFNAKYNPGWRSTNPTNEQITQSKIMARATVHIPGRQGVTIIAAFELSYYYAYWFVFQARSARTPRRLWKRVAIHTIYQGKIMTMKEMIDRVTFGKPDIKTVVRYAAGKRRFASSLDKTAHPTRNLTTPVGINPKDVEYYNRRHSVSRQWGR
jgi:hypothetical protein